MQLAMTTKLTATIIASAPSTQLKPALQSQRDCDSGISLLTAKMQEVAYGNSASGGAHLTTVKVHRLTKNRASSRESARSSVPSYTSTDVRQVEHVPASLHFSRVNRHWKASFLQLEHVSNRGDAECGTCEVEISVDRRNSERDTHRLTQRRRRS